MLKTGSPGGSGRDFPFLLRAGVTRGSHAVL